MTSVLKDEGKAAMLGPLGQAAVYAILGTFLLLIILAAIFRPQETAGTIHGLFASILAPPEAIISGFIGLSTAMLNMVLGWYHQVANFGSGLVKGATNTFKSFKLVIS